MPIYVVSCVGTDAYLCVLHLGLGRALLGDASRIVQAVGQRVRPEAGLEDPLRPRQRRVRGHRGRAAVTGGTGSEARAAVRAAKGSGERG